MSSTSLLLFLLAEIDRAFKQFTFECMDLKTAAEDGTITADGPGQHKPAQKDIMWDDPYPFYKGMILQTDGDEDEEEVMMEAVPEEKAGMTTTPTEEVQMDELRSGENLNSNCIDSDVTWKLLVTIDIVCTYYMQYTSI